MGKGSVARRFVLLVALAFWQGGFVFYASVVVPVAMSVLRPRSAQSFVTLEVTRFLNLAGAVALVLLALDLVFVGDPSRRRGVLRWLCWLLMALTLGVLTWLHPQLARWMDPETQAILDREALYPLHRLYLWTSTVQWFFATMLIVLLLRGWQEEDQEK